MTMQPDQQRRILGYFVEEAREHLNTIEQGLLNLQGTLDDAEMIQEVFRAAHSIKGGAAMLGLSSIQHTSHRLEDCFKILKDHPIQIDQTLESLLLGVCDTLKSLIDHLGSPFGLSEETAQELMSKTEPVMLTLHNHIESLVGHGKIEEAVTPGVLPPISVVPQVSNSLATFSQDQDWMGFQGQVLQILREMLQLFKQTGLSSSREDLRKCCERLGTIGRNLNLSRWCILCDSVAEAISNPDNSYLTLAKIIITDIKQAQELVLQNRDAEIVVSQQLQSLLPLPELEFLEFGDSDGNLSLFSSTDLELSVSPTKKNSFTELSLFNDDQSSVLGHNTFDYSVDDAGSEVRVSELNSLADLFEGDISEFDDGWQEKEILEGVNGDSEALLQTGQVLIFNGEVGENNQGWVDLLGFNDEQVQSSLLGSETDLGLLFDDNLLEIGNDVLSNNTDNYQSLESSYGLTNETDLQFPEDDVLEELISISREARQNALDNGIGDGNSVEGLLVFTEDNELYELSFDGELTTPELMSEGETDASSLFLPSVNEDISAVTPIITSTRTVKTPELRPSVPESFSFDNLFAEVVENVSVVRDEVDDLFGMPDTFNNVSSSVDDLDNFWGDFNSLDSGMDFAANEDVARELEESLFSGSFENVRNNKFTEGNVLDEDFNLVVQNQSETLNMFFTPDADFNNQNIDIFNEVPDITSISTNASTGKLPLPLNKDFSPVAKTVNSIPGITTDSDPTIPLSFTNGNDDNLSLSGEETIFNTENIQLQPTTNEHYDQSSILPNIETTSLRRNEPDFKSTPTEFNFKPGYNLESEPISKLKKAVSINPESIEVVLDNSLGNTKIELSPVDKVTSVESLSNNSSIENTDDIAIEDKDFAALEALLNEYDSPEINVTQVAANQLTPIKTIDAPSLSKLNDEFSELEDLLAQVDQDISTTASTSQKTTGKISRSSNSPRRSRDETMKIPVKQLDEMSNLIGELVVNRNTLEQNHQRLRQSLDNLLVQVQHLSDVGVRMQEYYERSLLESSLLTNRRSRENNTSNIHNHNSSGHRGFSEIEMDRFTPFHVLAQEMIEFIVRTRESSSDIDFISEETEQVTRQLRQATSQLQEGLTKARMIPFAQTIDRLRRGVRDNAIKYGKQIDLVTEGADTLVDKMILDHLTDPLIHIINNAIAHGIETPDIRQSVGKSPVGKITIRILQQGNQTIISVSDDGAGIDHERVKNKAVKKGILTPQQAEMMSRMEVYELLFLPSFSTADEVDDIKGRGIGMNVVQNDISEIRGVISTDSTLGQGTTFTIRLPLTLSICKAIFCVFDRARIAFPIDSVEDTLEIPANEVEEDGNGQLFIRWRDSILAFKPLKEILRFNRHLSRGNMYAAAKNDGLVSVIVVRSGSTMIGLEIDQVLSEQEIVIKQFENPVPKPSGVAGATVLGDGMIMPIADVLEIVDIFQGKMSKHIGLSWQRPNLLLNKAIANKVETTVLIVDDSITVRELLSLTFNKAGYRVEQARDGQEAWDKLRSGLRCDIVFCDIEMPRCDGLELLSRIQKDSGLSNLPIAMLTSRGADKHRQMAVQLGASGYFTKPYLEEALVEAASRMLKGEKLVTG